MYWVTAVAPTVDTFELADPFDATVSVLTRVQTNDTPGMVAPLTSQCRRWP